MTLGGLGAREVRQARVPFIPILSAVLLIAGVVQFGRELVGYSSSQESLQADVRVAGLQVGGLTETQAQQRWEAVYVEQPIRVSYRDNPIILNPETIGFRTNNDSMLAQVRAQTTSEEDFWGGFMQYLFAEDPDPIQVELDATLQDSQLRAALEDISRRYDSIPGGANFDITTLTFRGGQSGTRLDIERSMELIRTALYDPNPAARSLELPTMEVQGDEPEINDLREAVLAYMQLQGFLYDGATTIGSVFVMDLKTGQEMSILPDVQHSGVSTIKVGLMINFFRHRLGAPTPDEAYLLAAAMICSNNSAANFLAQASDPAQRITDGLSNASQTMVDVGAGNSALLSPLWVGPDGSYPQVARPQTAMTPNVSFNAQPDIFNFTTAEDMGTMMSQIYYCANGGGGLTASLGEDITQTECQQMLEIMSGVKFSRFSELGAPEGTRISHKVGYAEETVADVAIVFSPATDYVFVMYIWEDDESVDNNNLTSLKHWSLIDDISRIVYNYFNRDAPLLATRTPYNSLGGAACVMPKTVEEVNLNDINQNRLDSAGNPVPEACYDYPVCRPFDNWGQ